jgi:hypothetical protein
LKNTPPLYPQPPTEREGISADVTRRKNIKIWKRKRIKCEEKMRTGETLMEN